MNNYYKVFVSKVFTDTPIPESVQILFDQYKNGTQNRVEFGGTGFYFDKAPALPYEIEHHTPYYDLYLPWIRKEVEKAKELAASAGKEFNEKVFLNQYKEYTEYSIGFTTRGCFRKCPFCVNQKYDHVFLHSPLDEFVAPSRKKICLLDDNVLGSPHWRDILTALRTTGKPYKFKQGLDERLLTDEKCELLFTSKYDPATDITFAFDNIEDYDLIHEKLKMIRRHTDRKIIFYVLVGFKSTDAEDIENAFKRIELLFNYKCLPYIMRYVSKDDAPYRHSEYKDLYNSMARWCNQAPLVKKMSFREFCAMDEKFHKGGRTEHLQATRSLLQFEEKFPGIAEKYFDMRFGDPIL